MRSLIFLFLALCLPVFISSAETKEVDPRVIEAAFLRNFTHYVTWPDEVFANDRSPWRICVLGNDPFGDVLEDVFKGRTEQGRSFMILRSNDPAELSHCQIVYVAYEVSASRRAALARLKDWPVLTVSSAPGFLSEGGIIRFDVTDYVELSVNLDRARAASLLIQTKVLEVSSTVIENGKMRRMR